MAFARPMGAKRPKKIRQRPAVSPKRLVEAALSGPKISKHLLLKALREREHQLHRAKPYLSAIAVHDLALRDLIALIGSYTKNSVLVKPLPRKRR